MEAGEAAGRYQNLRLVLWIIEHVWKHKMMDVLQVVNASCWPNLDLQPLSLEESWKLRVGSAYVFSVVRSRDVALFQRVLDFLEAAYRLLPGLVAAIKHMKIMFGLKTLVVMAMLRDGRGSVDIVSKINQFFPNKLPEYLDHCTQREMFLMRKNHMDFKGLAQALALDKNKLQEYIESEMEEQYGERYAQKVEDRLLQYLQELEVALPGDTHVDKILKKRGPSTEEEQLLLDVLTSDCAAIAAALNKLLHCDVTSCRPDEVSQTPEEKEARTSGLSRSSLKVQLKVFRGDQDVSLERHTVLRGIRPSDDGGSSVFPVNTTAQTIRQFCSRHQRWVKSILQECPDDCATVSSSPPLFPSSSSTSSSQDLTPSNLVPSPPDRPSSWSTVPPAAGQTYEPSVVRPVDVTPSSTCEPSPPGPERIWTNPPSPSGSRLTPIDQTSRNQGSAQDETTSSRKACQREPEDPGDGVNCGSAGRTEPDPEPSSTGDSPSPSLLSPAVALNEVASSSKSIQTPLDCHLCRHHSVTSGSTSPSHQISGLEDPISGSSDNKRLPHPPESPISQKPSQTRQTLKCSTSQPLTQEVLQEPGDLQTSPRCSSCDLQVSGSPQHPASFSTTQRPEQELSSESQFSSWLSSSSDNLLPVAPSLAVQLVNSSSPSFSELSPTSPDDRAGSQQPAAMDNNPPSNQSSGINVSVSVPPPECLEERHSGGRLTPPRRPPRHLSTQMRETRAAVKRRKPSNKSPESPGCPPSLRSAAASETSPQDGTCSRSRDRTVRRPQLGDHLLPSPLMPVVRLVDIYSEMDFKRSQAPPCDVVRYSNNRSPSGARRRRTSRERDASSVGFKTGSEVETPPDCQDLPVVPETVSKLSLNTNQLHLHRSTLTLNVNIPGPPALEASRPPAPTRSLRQTKASTAPPLRLSLQSQASLLQSRILQPHVRLTRLEEEEQRRGSAASPELKSNEDDVDSSFDLNELYSSSEGSDVDTEPDPDYKPSLKKKRLLLEYENAKMADKHLDTSCKR